MKDIRNSTNSTFATSPKSMLLTNRKHYARFSEGVQFSCQNMQNQYDYDCKWVNKSQQMQQKNGQIDAFKKYSQFMGLQNEIISQVLLHGSKFNPQSKNKQQEMISKLRDSTNKFIKDLLQSLTESNSKLRFFKSNLDMKIQQLQYQLSNQKEQNKLLKQKMNEELQNYEEKYNRYTALMQVQIRKIQQIYQTKINQLSKKLELKQGNYDLLLTQKIQLNNQLINTGKLLKSQKEQINMKKKQYEGMEKLIHQYQKQMSNYEKQIYSMENENKKLKQNINVLQQSNNKLTNQVGKMTQMEVKHIKEKQQYKQLANQLQQEKTVFNKNIIEKNDLITEKDHKIAQLLTKIEVKQEKIKTLTSQLIQKYKIQSNYKQQMIKQKCKTKQKIQHIRKMYKRKQNLVKKAIVTKLKQLKTQNQKLKAYFQRQIFSFYQQIRMDLILNNSSQSNFVTMKNNRVSL